MDRPRLVVAVLVRGCVMAVELGRCTTRKRVGSGVARGCDMWASTSAWLPAMTPVSISAGQATGPGVAASRLRRQLAGHSIVGGTSAPGLDLGAVGGRLQPQLRHRDARFGSGEGGHGQYHGLLAA
jgi:hypothetical protein